jgi:hypothetical protein
VDGNGNVFQPLLYDAATNIVLLREAGFAIERMEQVDQDNENGRFLWIVARRPDSSAWAFRRS